MKNVLIKSLQYCGQNTIESCQRWGRSGILLNRTLFCCPPWKIFSLITKEIYMTGVLSLVIIIVSALFIGMVVALQGHHTLARYGADQELGQLLSLSVVRELGPVVTALLFAGRAGSALTAEIGLMVTTEQIASMEVMGVDPARRVIAPRLWGGFISMPLLNILFCVTAIAGGYWVSTNWLGVDGGSFMATMQSSLDFRADILSSIIKSLVFGFTVTWIAIYQGYRTKTTAEGISRATTRTVVLSSLTILALDFVLTAIMLGDW